MEILKKLPDELIREIGFLICSPQPKELCEDIRHFKKSYCQTMTLYGNGLGSNFTFLADLWKYTRILNTYQIWLRRFQMNTSYEIWNSKYKKTTSKCRDIWGLLNIAERNEFLRIKNISNMCSNNFPSNMGQHYSGFSIGRLQKLK